MKLHRLTLQNLKDVEYAELCLHDSMFFIGLNGAGKSTIHEAIQLALMGWCQHTDARGAGYADLIRDGAAQAVVELEFSHGGTAYRISLTLGKKREWLLTEIDTGEVREDIASPSALWAAFGINQRHALVCMFPARIVAGKEFSDILSSYLGGALTARALDDRITPEHRQYLVTLAGRRHIALGDVVGFESLGRVCYDRRTEINRDLKFANAKIAEYGFLKPVPGVTVDDMPRLRQQVTALLDTQRELYVQKGRAEAAPVNVLPLSELEAEHKAAQLAHAEAEAYAAAQRAVAETEEKMNAANEAARAAADGMDAARADAPKTCPTCGGKFTKAKREEYVAERVAACAEAVTAAEALQEAALAEANAARAALRELTPPPPGTAERLTAATAELEAARRMPPPYDGPPLAEVEQQLDKLLVDIQFINTQLSILEQHRELAECKTMVAALTEELSHVAFGVREFHDGVAYRELLAEAAAPIVARVNQYCGGGLDIKPDGKIFQLLYRGRRLDLASAGERARVAFAFATAFADCGAPVLLDETNELDPIQRGALCLRLREAATGTVILAGTPNNIGPEYYRAMAQALTPMRVVLVDAGTYREIQG
jgi:hypothetical protein